MTVKKISLLLLATLLTACSSLGGTKLNTFSGVDIFVEGDEAFISGVLDSSLPQKLTEVIRQSPNINTIVLVDIPGSLDQDATMATARLIRQLGLNTRIARTGYVLSGGVDLFLGGVRRSIGPGAGVGVHSWLDELGINPKELSRNDPIHATYVNFFLEMGVPEDFYWFSLEAAPADRVYFMSPEEIFDYQIDTE